MYRNLARTLVPTMRRTCAGFYKPNVLTVALILQCCVRLSSSVCNVMYCG